MQISLDEVSRVFRMQSVSGVGTAQVGESYRIEASGSTTTAASSVEMSDEAQEIRRVTKLVKKLPDVREDRVAELKAKIESGTYKVSGEEIADLIVRRAFADGMR